MSRLLLFKTWLLAFCQHTCLVFLYSLSVTGLEWASRLAGFSLWSRMTYLTDVRKFDTTHAAAIVNWCKGLETIMPIVMVFLVDAFLGEYVMLLSSTIVFILGMGFFSSSTLPRVEKHPNINFCEGASKCIADIRLFLFYLSIPFIIIGKSGHVASLQSVLKQQIQTESDQQPWNSCLCLWKVACFCIPIILGFAFTYLPWYAESGIPVILMSMMLMCIIFTGDSVSCSSSHIQGSPLTTVVRVIVASASKRRRLLPLDADQLYENRAVSVRLPHTKGLRCLNKAAVVDPNQAREQLEESRWKLCSLSEVEETKIFIRMIPMWSIFIMCGLVSSVGDTAFLGQAVNLDNTVGVVKFPAFILLIFQIIAEKSFATVTKKLTKKVSKKFAAPIGMVIAILFSVICCITAAKVETRRVDVIKRNELFEKPKEKIPMSMFWLVPQFLLLGAVDGISHNIFGVCDQVSGFSIACFSKGNVSDSIISYLQIFSDSVFGFGILGGVLSVYIVGKVKPSWFQRTLNESRLDNYYWILAVWSSLSLIVSIFVATWYVNQHLGIEKESTPQGELSASIEVDEVVAVV